MRTRFLAIVILSFSAVGCEMFDGLDRSEKPKGGTVEKSSCCYPNTFDFVWDSANAELLNSWQIESAKRETKTITTTWNFNLSPFSRHGGRERLIVNIVGDGKGGWRANATQQTQQNKNEEDPLDQAKAKWENTPNDGSLAAKFLQNLDTRLKPDERWRNQLTR
jgi:hypothetical protein